MARDVSMTEEQLWDTLRQPLTATLSTNGRDRYPHVAAMWYLPTAGQIRMATFAKSQKAVNLSRDPACAFHVECGQTYGELRGVLIQGEATLSEDSDLVLEIMCGIYERYRRPHQGTMSSKVLEQYRRQSQKRVAVCLPVERIATWDHRSLEPSVALRGGGAPRAGST